MGFPKRYLCPECTKYYPQHVMTGRDGNEKCIYCRDETHDSKKIREEAMLERKARG